MPFLVARVRNWQGYNLEYIKGDNVCTSLNVGSQKVKKISLQTQKKLAENGGSYYIKDDPKDFGHISVTTNDLNGLVGFINYWYNQDDSFGITTEKDLIKRFGIEVL